MRRKRFNGIRKIDESIGWIRMEKFTHPSKMEIISLNLTSTVTMLVDLIFIARDQRTSPRPRSPISDGSLIPVYSVGNIIYWSNAKKNQIYLTKLTPDGSGEQLGSFKTDNIYPEEISISSSSGFLFFTNNCGPRYTPGDECRLIFRSKMNGEKLCSVLHGTPKVTSLVAHQSPKSRNLVELYWNDSNKIRQIRIVFKMILVVSDWPRLPSNQNQLENPL